MKKISAGYQSRILDNAAWDDVTQMKEPHQPSSEAVVVVGAASKGIIKRDQQNNAIVYKTYYGQNPFAHMDNDEIEKYKREVEQNQMREQGVDDDHLDSRGTNGQRLTTPDKSITSPSGQKVTTSKSDTMKSTTSSSGPSSREVSPNRTSGSKGGGGDEVKKEKKSKFRTPSFLRKRKEKKEAAAKEKEKADK